MHFMDSYKRLEKLCGEIYGDSHGVKMYLQNMRATPGGAFYVSGWDEDLKRLDHYRRVRNQISHEPGCTEENMCEPGDAQWLDDFYARVLSTNDPLALYRKATSPRVSQKPRQAAPQHERTAPKPTSETPPQEEPRSSKAAEYLLYFLLALFFVAAMTFAEYCIWCYSKGIPLF